MSQTRGVRYVVYGVCGVAIVRRVLQGRSGLPGYRGPREDSRVALAPESTDETPRSSS